MPTNLQSNIDFIHFIIWLTTIVGTWVQTKLSSYLIKLIAVPRHLEWFSGPKASVSGNADGIVTWYKHFKRWINNGLNKSKFYDTHHKPVAAGMRESAISYWKLFSTLKKSKIYFYFAFDCEKVTDKQVLLQTKFWKYFENLVETQTHILQSTSTST